MARRAGVVARRHRVHGRIVQGGRKLTFAKGASLPDPATLFNASLDGNVRRAIDLRADDKINDYLNMLLKTDGEDYIIAVDTDSVYLRLGDLVDKTINADGEARDPERVISFLDKVCENKIQPVIDNACRELGEYTNVFQQKIVMKREVLADKAIWTAKKRYIMNVHNSEGVQYKEPQIKITGLEAIKSSTPTACRDKIKEALHIIMTSTESQLHEMIENFRDEFKKLPIEDIAFPR